MNEPVYEMLWDCASCGTTALLGKSQRRCPNCGAPQDPAKRYFPKPGEAVEVQGHRYEGADWACAACTTPNGAAASFCVNCGNPKDGNAAVVARADRIVKDGAVVEPPPGNASSAAKPAAGSGGRVVAVVAAALALLLVIVAVLVLWKKDAVVDVTGHRWTREVDVERFDAVRESAWCDQLPAGSYNVSRHREVRSQRQVPDGEECHDRHVDKGDGTFTVKKECKPKYRSEPVYADKCDFSVDRWHVVRADKASGDLKTAPQWPASRLSGLSAGRGAERTGARRESYEVLLRDANSGKTHECAFPEAKWRSIADGARLKMKVRMIGAAVCDTLQ
jgi:hypothetical protein